MVDIKRLEDLTPDPQNANLGTKRGGDLLEQSLRNYGAGRSILADRNGVVIAGNKTLEKAVEMGLGIKVVKTRGHDLVVVQREDLDMEHPAARELAIADNRVTEIDLKWNPSALSAAIEDGLRVNDFFFGDELERLTQSAADFVDNAGAMGVPPELHGNLQDEIDAAAAPNLTAGEEKTPGPVLGTPVISYVCVFDNDEQQRRWFAFLRYLKGRYVDQPTIGARLDQYLREQEAVNPALAKAD